MSQSVVRVLAHTFECTLTLDGNEVIDAEPPLQWTIGKPRAWLRQYFKVLGWKATLTPPAPSTDPHP